MASDKNSTVFTRREIKQAIAADGRLSFKSWVEYWGGKLVPVILHFSALIILIAFALLEQFGRVSEETVFYTLILIDPLSALTGWQVLKIIAEISSKNKGEKSVFSQIPSITVFLFMPLYTGTPIILFAFVNEVNTLAAALSVLVLAAVIEIPCIVLKKTWVSIIRSALKNNPEYSLENGKQAALEYTVNLLAQGVAQAQTAAAEVKHYDLTGTEDEQIKKRIEAEGALTAEYWADAKKNCFVPAALHITFSIVEVVLALVFIYTSALSGDTVGIILMVPVIYNIFIGYKLYKCLLPRLRARLNGSFAKRTAAAFIAAVTAVIYAGLLTMLVNTFTPVRAVLTLVLVLAVDVPVFILSKTRYFTIKRIRKNIRRDMKRSQKTATAPR